MKISNTVMALAVAAMLLGVAPQVTADAGHDHGDAPTAAAGPALPRFAAVSELFELVGVVKGNKVTLYLDRFADNSPVRNASLELQFDGNELPVEAHGDGKFEASLPQGLKEGVVSVTATVIAGEESDLLAGDLELRGGSGAHPEAVGSSWRTYGGWVGAGALVLGLVGWGALRKGRNRNASTGGEA